MSTDDKARAQSLVARLLHDAEERTMARDYKEALVAIRKAKALDSSNVYILALERQVEQLQQFGDSSLLSEGQRVEVLESLPGLMQRALSQQTALSSPEEVASMETIVHEDEGEREAAQQWLKNQYFQRAHEHVRKGEYQLALWEIRRIYIVDSQDRFAKEFEQRILQLLDMQGPVTPPAPPPPEEQQTEPARPRKPVAPPIYQPGAHSRSTPPPPIVEDFPKPKRKFRITNRVLLFATLLTLAALCFAFYYFWQRELTKAPPTPVQTQPVNP